jgi:membrane protease YdiL (CAAX protease family)
MKKIIQNNPVISFIVITFVFSWTLWLLMILSNKHILPFQFPTNFLGSFGPAIGGLIVTAVISGKKGIKTMLRSLIKLKTSFWAYGFSVLLIPLIYGLTFVIFNLTEPKPLNVEALPGVAELVIYFFIIAIIGGPLGEEIGWRGFLQGRLMDRFSPFVTSLLISIIWFAWHLPLFWLEGAAQEGSSIFEFELSLIAMSFLFTLLYIKSKGSLFQAILFHTVINYISAVMIPTILPASENNKAFGNIFMAVLIGAAVFYFLLYNITFTRRPELQVSDFEEGDIH